MNLLRTRLCVACCVFALILPAASAQSRANTVSSSDQTPGGAEPGNSDAASRAAPGNQQVAVGEIIVTAQKRSESVQKVAASITALGGESLVERGLSNNEQLASQVPSLQFAEHATSTLFAIRGISLDITTGAGEPSVATHIDGVYQPRVTAPAIDMTDLDRVEVLRGPQGTLYGRNSTGGAINFVSAAPTADLTAGATIGIGSFDQRMVRGYLSGPIVGDVVRARLAASYDRNDGPTVNLFDGQRLEGRERYYLHGSLAISPDGPLSAELGAYYINEKLSGPVQYNLEQGPFFGLLFPGQDARTTTEPYRVFNDLTPRTERDLLLFTGRLAWKVSDDITVRSITGYAEHKYRSRFDGDGTALPYIAVGTDLTGPRRGDSKSFSQELNIGGTVSALDFVAGLFYFDEKFDPYVVFEFPLGIPSAAPPTTAFLASARERTHSYAGFVDLTYRLTDRFRLVGGLRVGEDRKRYRQTFGFSLPGFPLGTGPGIACQNENYRAKWSSFTPKAGVQFDATDRIMLYAQYQRGFKSGAFNLTACGNEVDPEKITSYEVGIKSRLIGNTLTLNISGFHYDYKDLQVLRFVNVGGVDTSILDNAATAKVDGIEIEALARPTRNFDVSIAFSYLDARYDRYLPGNGADYSGNQLNRAPRYSIKSAVEQRIPLSGALEEFRLRGELNLTSRVFYTPDNGRQFSQPSTVIANVSATIAAANDIELRAFGRNLFDQAVRVNAFPSATQNAIQGFYGLPRTWGVELSKRF